MNKTTIILTALALFLGLGAGILIRTAVRDTPSEEMPTGPGMSPPKHEGHQMVDKNATTDSRPAVPSQLAAGKIHDIANAKCPIMGGEVDGESFALIYNDMLVRFCCPGCDGEFLKRPLEHLKAMKAEGTKVPGSSLTADAHPEVIAADNTMCPVLEQKIGDSTIYAVHRGIKVKLCCEDCRKAFAANPDKYLFAAAKSGNVPKNRLPEEDR